MFFLNGEVRRGVGGGFGREVIFVISRRKMVFVLMGSGFGLLSLEDEFVWN